MKAQFFPISIVMQRRSDVSKRGVAIIIVLLFIVLLSGIILAFFMRSLNNLKISENNAEQIKVNLFAQGTVEMIVGDLKQEIVDGSATPITFENGTRLYVPNGSTNAVPQRVGTDDALPNLIKRSASGIPLYTFGSAMGPSKASSISTETASANGRSYMAARWNISYLLPKKYPTDSTKSDPVAMFAPPHWIYVARDGSNPRTWTPNNAIKGTNPVLGRYAFCIYDEGGLLDVNVAGYPMGPNGCAASQSSYKPGTAFADMSLILGPDTASGAAGFPAARSLEIVNQIVGWRNYATARPSGALPSLVPASGTGDSYFKYVLSNGRGFNSVGNTSLYNGQSDRRFSSRQEFIKFLLQALAGSSDEKAKMQVALQYLSTFTRDLNQPSYVPDPSRPKVAALPVAGGNDAFGGDDKINSSFLATRVTSVFTRNDGTNAVVGEPLVKQRFALARLAWITCLGPSASRNLNPPNTTGDKDYDIWLLQNQHGVTREFLQLGTAANVYKYFGLSWVPDPNNPGSFLWIYNHEGSSPLTSPTSGPIKIRTIKEGSSIVTGREPDFFELLKAGTTVGSLAKAYGAATDLSNASLQNNKKGRAYYAAQDVSIDNSVLQMGANILSQASTSGYSTRILFNCGLYGNRLIEYRGIQDLPYLYNVREGKFIVKDSTPSYASLSTIAVGTVSDPGQGVSTQEPCIWNPHSWSSGRPDTAPRPTRFRIIALTQDPNGNVSPYAVACSFRPPISNYSSETSTDASLRSKPLTLTAESTELLFSIDPDKNYLFREPSLLIKPNVPNGSNLTVGSAHTIKATFGTDYILSLNQSTHYTAVLGNVPAADDKRYVGIVLRKDLPMAWPTTLPAGAITAASPANPGSPGDPSAKPPIPPTTPTPAVAAVPSAPTPGVVPAGVATLVSGDCLTYRLQYQDPAGNWITYDEKYVPICIASDVNSNSLKSFNGGSQVGSEWMSICFDPRAGKFGMNMAGANYRGSGDTQIPILGRAMNNPYNVTGRAGWALPVIPGGTLSAADNTALQNATRQNALWTMRPDEAAGFTFTNAAISTGPTSPGWYPSQLTSMTQPGLATQNNPAITSSTYQFRWTKDNQGNMTGLRCFADADGVIRRGMSAYVRPSTSAASYPAESPASALASGQPMRTAYAFNAIGTITPNADAASRPFILNRPFRSVAELGYVFSGTPWRNIDFSTPESGSSPLLDIFCINPTDDTDSLTAGKVNLNTRQPLVLQAILAGSYRDELSPSGSSVAPLISALSTDVASARKIAEGLIARTSSTGTGPLLNMSELVGKWSSAQPVPSAVIPFNLDGGASYSGFSGSTSTSAAPSAMPVTLCSILADDVSASGYSTIKVPRYREAAIRSLASSGQTRVWNLMIDVVSQTGNFSDDATGLANFRVKGEQRYWVHVAIDRLTGQVLDQQIEVVKE